MVNRFSIFLIKYANLLVLSKILDRFVYNANIGNAFLQFLCFLNTFVILKPPPFFSLLYFERKKIVMDYFLLLLIIVVVLFSFVLKVVLQGQTSVTLLQADLLFYFTFTYELFIQY